MALVRGLMAASMSLGIDVECVPVDVHKDRRCPAVADAVGGCDVGVTDCDHFIPRTDAGGQQRQMQRRGAIGNGTGVRSADARGEFLLERSDLGSLGNPAGKNDAPNRVSFPLAETRFGNWNHRFWRSGLCVGKAGSC